MTDGRPWMNVPEGMPLNLAVVCPVCGCLVWNVPRHVEVCEWAR